jgi:hypothetical protein
MLRSFDIVLVGVMVAAAVATYTIKHRADDKLAQVRKLETEIKLEKDTIELLKADWALLTQPNRLQRLATVYSEELKLVPTLPTQLARPVELPMLRSQLPQPPEPEGMSIEDAIAAATSGSSSKPSAPIRAASAKGGGTVTVNGIPVPRPRATDATITGSVNR